MCRETGSQGSRADRIGEHLVQQADIVAEGGERCVAFEAALEAWRALRPPARRSGDALGARSRRRLREPASTRLGLHGGVIRALEARSDRCARDGDTRITGSRSPAGMRGRRRRGDGRARGLSPTLESWRRGEVPRDVSTRSGAASADVPVWAGGGPVAVSALGGARDIRG